MLGIAVHPEFDDEGYAQASRRSDPTRDTVGRLRGRCLSADRLGGNLNNGGPTQIEPGATRGSAYRNTTASHDAQRTTIPGASTYTWSPARTAVLRHAAHVQRAVVTSKEKTVASAPAVTLPSSLEGVSLMSLLLAQPYRSVLIDNGAWPRPMRSLATDSTNAVGPQTNT